MVRTQEEIERALHTPGFTPSFRDLPVLLALAGRSEDDAHLVEKALVRLGEGLGERIPKEVPERALRPLVRALGKLPTTEAAFAFMSSSVEHDAVEVRRAAAVALGKVAPTFRERAEPILLKALERSTRDFEARAVVEALGKIGTAAAERAISGWKAKGSEDERVKTRAATTLARDLGRSERTIDLERPLPRLTVDYQCRKGLAPILEEELAEYAPTRVSEGRVSIRTAGALRERYVPRTALRFSFPLEEGAGGGRAKPLGRRVIDALSSDIARTLLEVEGHVTRFRFRPRAGKQRELQWDLAARVSSELPWLRNDPREPEWELVESERGLELSPSAAIDPRFSYRSKDVPAASHPTIAAALARVAEVHPDDIVWDPFVGSGLELIEHAMLGPARARIGTDLDDDAIRSASANAEAASTVLRLERRDVRELDAGLFSEGRPTLLLTNPPFGHRLLSRDAVLALLEGLLVGARDLLAPRARIAWLSPLPEATLARARSLGFRVARLVRVDAGALVGEIQLLFVP